MFKKSHFVLFLLWSIALLSCQPSQKASLNNDYHVLLDEESLSDWEGKGIQFTARICNFEMQHMLRPSFDGATTYICVERLDKKGAVIGQYLAYSNEADMLRETLEEKKFTVMGVVGKISGAGKGGGTHTEYFLELDNVKME